MFSMPPLPCPRRMTCRAADVHRCCSQLTARRGDMWKRRSSAARRHVWSLVPCHGVRRRLALRGLGLGDHAALGDSHRRAAFASGDLEVLECRLLTNGAVQAPQGHRIRRLRPAQLCEKGFSVEVKVRPAPRHHQLPRCNVQRFHRMRIRRTTTRRGTAGPRVRIRVPHRRARGSRRLSPKHSAQ